jgi:hypothetical protein
MSKIAAIFVRTDNTQWDFTQPMSNLLMLGSQVLPVLLLTSPYNMILADTRHCPISLLIRAAKLG